MLKVAYVGIKGLPAKAGVDRVVEAVVARMPEYGVEPTVYCDRAHTAEDYALPGAKVVRVSSIPGKYFQAPSRFLGSSLQAVMSGEYDLVHLHNVEAGFVLPLLRMRYPVVSTAHGFAYWRSKWGPLAKRFMRVMDYPFTNFSSRVTSVSAKDAQDLESRFKKKVQYIPNGVSLDYSPNTQAANEILEGVGLKPKEYFLFAAGRIEPTKGAHLAIQAVKNLEKDVPLLIVGDLEQLPAYGRELREMADSRVFFHPLISEPETLFGLMRQSLCLVFPSLFEAMSMVLLEAASFGVPTIASDIPENSIVMGDDVIYFESGDWQALSEQMRWALDNRAVLIQYGERARGRIHQQYSWEKIAAQYYEVYASVVNHH